MRRGVCRTRVLRQRAAPALSRTWSHTSDLHL